MQADDTRFTSDPAYVPSWHPQLPRQRDRPTLKIANLWHTTRILFGMRMAFDATRQIRVKRVDFIHYCIIQAYRPNASAPL